MNWLDLQAVAPLACLAIGSVVMMLQVAWRRVPVISWYICSATLLVALGSIIPATSVGTLQVTPLLLSDKLSALFTALFCLGALVTLMLSRRYITGRAAHSEEFYLLLLLATSGAVVLAYANHLASLLLGMELLSVSIYVLVAYPERGDLPLEAAIKYLVLSGAATASLLFGFALLYAATGELGFTAIGLQLESGITSQQPALVALAAALIIVGLGFKLSLVPFHMWTPDIYQGAPAPVTGFLASVGKAAIFVVLLRWYLDANFYQYSPLVLSIEIIAVASMLIGNLLALLQDNIKRMLAYSSIAHMGYLAVLLVACARGNQPALVIEAAAYFLTAYMASSLAAFALLNIISAASKGHERQQLADISALFWHRPLLACLLSVALLSLAGIPATAGFFAKFYLFSHAVDASLWPLVSSLVIGSSIGIFYYLRAIYTMFQQPKEAGQINYPSLSRLEQAIAYGLIAIILYLGIAPQALMLELSAIL